MHAALAAVLKRFSCSAELVAAIDVAAAEVARDAVTAALFTPRPAQAPTLILDRAAGRDTTTLDFDAPAFDGAASADGALPSRYVDLGPIGVGGMGEVRRVRDLELNRVLALKIAHP
jgi:hypothetical protein